MARTSRKTIPALAPIALPDGQGRTVAAMVYANRLTQARRSQAAAVVRLRAAA